jgi:hypothetical protein
MTRREPFIVALALFLMAGAALRPSIHGMDGVGNYVPLASLLGSGDLDYRDDYALFDARRDYPFRFADLPVSPATGLPSNRYGVGSAILWSPFVVATHLAARGTDGDTADLSGRPYAWAVGIGTAWWGSLSLWLIYRKLRARWSAIACASALAALGLATPLGFYLYAHGSMSHGTGFFAVTALLLAFDRAWKRPDSMAAMAGCGAFSGLLVITRFQDAPWAILVAGALFWRIARPSAASYGGMGMARKMTLGLIFTAAGFLAVFPQLAVWRVLYGSWFSGPLPYLDASAGSFSPWPSHLLAALVSERGGVLAWHPAMALGLIGLCFVARREATWRPMATLGLAGFAGLSWLVGSWSMWWGGASFGNRFFISTLPFIAIGIAWMVDAAAGRRRLSAALCLLAILIVWNLGLLFQYATEMIPREDPVPWSQVIRQNVIEVPGRILGLGDSE